MRISSASRWTMGSAALAVALGAVACTGQTQAPPVRSMAQPAPAPAPYRASPSVAMPAPVRAPAPLPTPLPSHTTGSIHWHSRIADAQAEARAQGKLILIGSTKPGCSLCDKFAHETAPQCNAQLSSMAVCYMYDITRPEDGRVDRTLRANLVGAAIMPLVGFVTPDLQWVHGFSGPRSVSQFMGDIESARRIYPVRTASVMPEAAPEAPYAPGAPDAPALASASPSVSGNAVAFVNEYGETEWSAPADAWPAPVDALTGTPAIAAAPAEGAPRADATLAAAPAPLPVEPLATEPGPAAGWSSPAPAGVAASSRPLRFDPPVESTPEPAPVPVSVPTPAPTPSPTPVVAVETPNWSALPAAPISEEEGRAHLSRAYELIRAGRLDEARAILRQVSKSLPNTALGREADKGGVAVYNARRIAEADAGSRSELTQRARQDLRASMWSDLF